MGFYSIVIICGLLSLFALIRNSFLLAIGAGGAWLALLVYVEGDPPGTLVRGDPAHVMLVLALFAAAIAIPLISVARYLGRDREKPLDLTISKPTSSSSLLNKFTGHIEEGKRPTQPTEDTDDYRTKVHNALHKGRKRRRG